MTMRGHKTLADGTRVAISEEEIQVIWKLVEKQNAEDRALMPDEASARRMMSRAYHRLKAFGWREAIYCPKDGRAFQVIEAGSSGIHIAHYEGKWPNGSWWVSDGGDLWPSRPVLFRLNPEIRPIPATTPEQNVAETKND